MAISEEKMKIVINNYFKTECSIDTTIRQAFEKGFRLGVKKASKLERKKGKWLDDMYCSECMFVSEVESGFIGSVKQFNFCPNCGANMKGE